MRGKFSFKLPRLYSIAFILMNFLLWTQRPGQKANSGIGKLQNHRQIVDSESNAISPNSTRILLKHKNQQEILNSSHDSKSLLRFRISVEQGNNSWPPQPNEAHTLTQGSANQTTIVNRSDNRIRQEFRFQKDQQIPPMPLHSNTPNLVWTYELPGGQIIDLEQVHPDVAVEAGLEYTKRDRDRSAGVPSSTASPPAGVDAGPAVPRRISRIWIWGTSALATKPSAACSLHPLGPYSNVGQPICESVITPRPTIADSRGPTRRYPRTMPPSAPPPPPPPPPPIHSLPQASGAAARRS